MNETSVMEFLLWWVPRVAGVLLAAMAVECWLRRRGDGRSGVLLWKGVFVLAVVSPVLALVLPAIEVDVPAGVGGKVAPTGLPLEVDEAAMESGGVVVAGVVETEVAGTGNVGWGLLLWCGVVVLLGVRWLTGIVVAWRMRARATVLDWSEVGREIGGWVPGVMESRDVVSPVLVGVLRPVVLVPARSEDWSAEQKRMVLLHETAHARGMDVFFSILAGAVCVVQWFNPLAWTARRCLVRWQERVADEAVMAGGGNAKRYAKFLVELAGGWRREPLTGLAAKAMARPSGIEERVEKILVWGMDGGCSNRWLQRVLVGYLGIVFVAVSVDVEAKDKESEAAPDGAMFTRTYNVPPDFLSRGEKSGETAMEVIKHFGVELPSGSNAIYSPADSRLVVRTTQAGMEALGKVVDKIVTHVQRQVYFHTVMVEVESKKLDTNGEILGGVIAAPEGGGEFGISGVFTDPQMQVIYRALKSAGSDIAAMPSVVARSGHEASIEVEERLKLGLTGTAADDGYTIDIDFDFGGKTKTAVTVWDGQTVGFLTEKVGNKLRYVFVSARLIDPAGQPINAVEKVTVSDTKRKLDTIVIPNLSFMEAELKDVVDFLRHEAKRRDPEGKGVNLVLSGDAAKLVEAKITLELTDVPLGQVLKYVGQLGGLEILVKDEAVTLRPAGSENASKKKPAKRTEASTLIEKKLKEIVIPVAVFDQATVEEAVDFLRRKSAELDTGEADKQKRGVNFIIKAGRPDSLKGKSITLSLTNIPLSEVIKYVGELGGLETEIVDYGVVLKAKR